MTHLFPSKVVQNADFKKMTKHDFFSKRQSYIMVKASVKIQVPLERCIITDFKNIISFLVALAS